MSVTLTDYQKLIMQWAFIEGMKYQKSANALHEIDDIPKPEFKDGELNGFFEGWLITANEKNEIPSKRDAERIREGNEWFTNYGGYPHSKLGDIYDVIDLKHRDGSITYGVNGIRYSWTLTGLLDDIIEWRS